MRGLHQDLGAIHVDRITGPQQGHALHRAAIDVDSRHATGHLQPQAATIHAELRHQGALRTIRHADQAIGFAHDAMHAGHQWPVGRLTIAEVESQVIHDAGA